MKRLILSLAIGMISASGNAQWVSGGPELGINFSSLSTMSNGTMGNNGVREGLKIGGVVDIGFTRHFSLQPGLFYSVKGAQERYISTTSNIDNSIVTTHEDKYDYRINYLELPIDLKFRYGPFILGGGPYIARALGGSASNQHITTVTTNGNSDVTTRSSGSNLQVGNDAKVDDIRSTDIGLNLNVGLQSHTGFFVRANWGIGFYNIMPGGDANNYMHNNSFSLSAGYLFGH